MTNETELPEIEEGLPLRVSPNSPARSILGSRKAINHDDLDVTIHSIKGSGILASKDLTQISAAVFAEGCITLFWVARGDEDMVKKRLGMFPGHRDFRDYDRRTALHVAAAEGECF